jgi:cycloeucalenol cycloisomerase
MVAGSIGESASATPGLLAALSPNPARRVVELYWLKYTVVWGAVAGVIMVGGLAESWGDAPLMTLGVAFALGALVPPLLRPHESERAQPWWQRTAFKLCASLVGFSFLMNYFCTPYFFDVLHMHFGFDTRIHIQHNPVFLYLMTVAYFATYLVLVCGGLRMARRWLAGRRRVVGYVAAPFAVAALETALNANPFMKSLFCFDDMPFMLWFGTLSYGICFVFALPVWMSVDDEADQRRPLSHVVVATLAAMMMIVISFELLRHHVAPYVTTVIDGANGLRDFDTSCLVRP